MCRARDARGGPHRPQQRKHCDAHARASTGDATPHNNHKKKYPNHCRRCRWQTVWRPPMAANYAGQFTWTGACIFLSFGCRLFCVPVSRAYFFGCWFGVEIWSAENHRSLPWIISYFIGVLLWYSAQRMWCIACYRDDGRCACSYSVFFIGSFWSRANYLLTNAFYTRNWFVVLSRVPAEYRDVIKRSSIYVIVITAKPHT